MTRRGNTETKVDKATSVRTGSIVQQTELQLQTSTKHWLLFLQRQTEIRDVIPRVRRHNRDPGRVRSKGGDRERPQVTGYGSFVRDRDVPTLVSDEQVLEDCRGPGPVVTGCLVRSGLCRT